METEVLTTDISAVLRGANDKFETAFARGDAAGMAELYTENGMLLPAGTDIIQGKEGIQRFWQSVMDMGVKQAKLQTVEAEWFNDTAVELGKYTLSAADGQMLDHGKYIVIWKRQNGDWKLQKDIWTTTNTPA